MAIYIGTEEEEWKKVLDNPFLLDLVLEGYGAEPIDEYGAYAKIPKELRKRILNWLRKQPYYYEMLVGDMEEVEEQEEKEEKKEEEDELDQRISHLEDVLKHLKHKKEKRQNEKKEMEMKEKEMRKRRKTCYAEGSGANY